MSTYSFQQFTQLEGSRLLIRPVQPEDIANMAQILISDTTWFAKVRGYNTSEKFDQFFENVFAKSKQGQMFPVLAENKSNSEIVALSIYQWPSADFKKIEIGFSWIADAWQRTYVNTELKYLMLQHCFEVMRTQRVEFSVHPTNDKSNAAMKRIGAVYEGTLRKLRTTSSDDDGNRNIYSIIDDEWPEVSKRLRGLMIR